MILEKLEEQREIVFSWKEDWDESKRTPYELTIRDLLTFWDFFKQYSLNQLENSDGSVCTVVDYESAKKVRRLLGDIEKTISLLMHLDLLFCEIERVLQIEDEIERLNQKREWIERFQRFLRRKTTPTMLDAAERTSTKSNAKGENLSIPKLGLKDFIQATSRGKLSNAFKKAHPIMDQEDGANIISREDRTLLTAYQKHPIYHCYKEIKKELSLSRIMRIAPYYLLQCFVHKNAPLNPFQKKTYSFRVKSTEVKDRISVETDLRVHHYQKCNYDFFENLCNWLDLRPSETRCDVELNRALFVRCRHQAIHKDWLLMGSMPQWKLWVPEHPIYQLYQQLNGIFEYRRFPIYTKTLCRPEDMFFFYYNNKDCKISKVRSRIKKLLTAEKVEEYKAKAFLSEEGFGKSVMPKKWHMELAKWLESIIRSDEEVLNYVAGEEDPYYPLTATRISEINSAIIWNNEVSKIFREDVQVYLSVVETYIQEVCCDKIRQELQPQVLSLCKRVFLGD